MTGDPLTAALLDLLPMLERLRRLDSDTVVRLRLEPDRVTAWAPLPVGVLAGRTLRLARGDVAPADVTVGAAALADVLAAADGDDGDRGEPLRFPPRRDLDWRHTPPPRDGWSRVAHLADEQVRGAVRDAARAVTGAPLPAAAEVEMDRPAFPDAGVPAVAALDRRGPAGLVRLGFLPRGGTVAVDVAGGWTRLVAAYGSVYVGGSAGRAAAGPSLLTVLR